MKDLRQQFIDKLTLAGRAQKTIENYVWTMKGITRYFRKNPLSLTAAQIEEYLLHLTTEKKYAPTTINLTIGALKTFYKLCAPGSRVMERIGKAKQHKHLPVVLSKDEVKRLIDSIINLKQRAAVMLLYSAGLRVKECVTLRTADIDSDRMKVRVVNAKGKKDRYTLLSHKMLETLRKYYRFYKPGELLFAGLKKGHYSVRSVGLVIRRAAKKAGINKHVTPHTLRHRLSHPFFKRVESSATHCFFL